MSGEAGTTAPYRELLWGNERYAVQLDLGKLAMPPARKPAVVACMDARLNVEELLDLEPGNCAKSCRKRET